MFHEHALHGESSDHVLHRSHAHESVEVVEHLIERSFATSVILLDVGRGELIHVHLLEFLLSHLLDETLALSFHALVEEFPCLAGVTEVIVTSEAHLLKRTVYRSARVIVEGVFACRGHIEEYL